jgi:hypothetical protein
LQKETIFVSKSVFEYARLLSNYPRLQNPELFPREIFFLKNGRVFWAKLKFFVVLSKFDQNNFFQKFKKNLVRKGLNQQKKARDKDFRAPGGHESLWTAGKKKNGFSLSTVKSRNNQIWIFFFEGFSKMPFL